MRRLLILSLFAITSLQAQKLPVAPERAIRNSIPMTNTILNAFRLGTRDSTGKPGRNYWQTRTDYTINAKLDVATSRLTGHESIVIHNNSDAPMTNVRLRLDMNIFRPKSYLASSWVLSENTDGFDITKLSVNGQDATLAAAAGGRGGRGGGGGGGGGAGGGAPSLGGQTSTNATVTLAEPIPAKGSATLVIDWNHKIPGAAGNFPHRMNQRWGDTLYQPTQWYPRVAVYDDLRGWDTELYLGPSEFYNNFGKFDVTIDVPAGWVVSGTGVLKNPEQVLTAKARERLSHLMESDSVITVVAADEAGPGKSTLAGDRLQWHYVADTVNDFAWATARNYVWQVTRVTIPGRSPMELHMVFQPGGAGNFTRAATVARHALQYYSKLWMPLDFPKLTMQDGPSNGMEYPMVINANQGAADHETGHQWWPMTVGVNETWYGWMDEGFNQYMNIWSDADAAGRPYNLNSRGQSYGAQSGRENEGTLMWNANYGGSNYSFQAYSKMPLVLSSLGGIVGDSAVVRATAEYAKAWKFKHPSPWDYFFFMNHALNRDLSWFWYYWFFANESVDGALTNVSTSGSGVKVTVHQAGEMPSPVVLRVEFEAKGKDIKKLDNAVMKDSVTAIVTYPVDVWFDGKRDFTAEMKFGGRKITRILLDPGCRFPDKFTADNVWTPEVGITVQPVASASGRGTAGAGAPAGRGAGGGNGRGGQGAGGGVNLCPGA